MEPLCSIWSLLHCFDYNDTNRRWKRINKYVFSGKNLRIHMLNWEASLIQQNDTFYCMCDGLSILYSFHIIENLKSYKHNDHLSSLWRLTQGLYYSILYIKPLSVSAMRTVEICRNNTYYCSRLWKRLKYLELWKSVCLFEISYVYMSTNKSRPFANRWRHSCGWNCQINVMSYGWIIYRNLL